MTNPAAPNSTTLPSMPGRVITEGSFPPPRIIHSPEPLSRRDQFALAAMQGLASTARGGTDAERFAYVARLSVGLADALIRALGEPKP